MVLLGFYENEAELLEVLEPILERSVGDELNVGEPDGLAAALRAGGGKAVLSIPRSDLPPAGPERVVVDCQKGHTVYTRIRMSWCVRRICLAAGPWISSRC